MREADALARCGIEALIAIAQNAYVHLGANTRAEEGIGLPQRAAGLSANADPGAQATSIAAFWAAHATHAQWERGAQRFTF